MEGGFALTDARHVLIGSDLLQQWLGGREGGFNAHFQERALCAMCGICLSSFIIETVSKQ